MNDTEFHRLADDFYQLLTEKVDPYEDDIEWEINGSVLELEFTDRSKIIINRQEPLHQIWVATKFNGHHFEYRDGPWIDNREGGELLSFLSAAIEKQSGIQVNLTDA